MSRSWGTAFCRCHRPDKVRGTVAGLVFRAPPVQLRALITRTLPGSVAGARSPTRIDAAVSREYPGRLHQNAGKHYCAHNPEAPDRSGARRARAANEAVPLPIRRGRPMRAEFSLATCSASFDDWEIQSKMNRAILSSSITSKSGPARRHRVAVGLNAGLVGQSPALTGAGTRLRNSNPLSWNFSIRVELGGTYRQQVSPNARKNVRPEECM